MGTTMVHYTVKPDQAARNEELVRAVYGELSEVAPAGFRYATFVAEDGVSFVHLAMQEDDGASPLMGLTAFRTFLDGLDHRIDAPREQRSMREVGSYGVRGG